MPPKKSSVQQQQQQPSAAASGYGSLLVEGGDPIASAIAIIEKKARNLEKRKVGVVSDTCTMCRAELASSIGHIVHCTLASCGPGGPKNSRNSGGGGGGISAPPLPLPLCMKLLAVCTDIIGTVFFIGTQSVNKTFPFHTHTHAYRIGSQV